MLSPHIKQAPCDRDRRGIKSTRHASTYVAIPRRADNLPDLEPVFEFLRSLIEVRVVKRLEDIFEYVRRFEATEICKPDRRAIRLREVLSILGISKSTLYDRLSKSSPSYDQRMPKPFKLGSGKNIERAPSVWWYADVIAYLESCARTRDSK